MGGEGGREGHQNLQYDPLRGMYGQGQHTQICVSQQIIPLSARPN